MLARTPRFAFVVAVVATLLVTACGANPRTPGGAAAPTTTTTSATSSTAEDDTTSGAAPGGTSGAASTTAAGQPPTSIVTSAPAASGKPSPERTLALLKSIGGAISPKSVVASQHGLVFAQNMMYQHTMTVYDRSHTLVKTIPDSVDLSTFGLAKPSATYRGAPVEAAFSADGSKVYVSNYQMYGPGYVNPGSDNCGGSSKWDTSFVYRVDVATLAIDQVISVGAVPKYVATTPDGRYVLVTNWCSYDLSVIDAAAGKEVKRIPLGPYPRGIAVSHDSSTAFVAVMGTTHLTRVNLGDLSITGTIAAGSGPRHVVLSPDGSTLYVTLNGEGTVAKIDAASGRVLGKVRTGQATRSLTISDDGLSLYVVNYDSNTVSKVRAADLKVLQNVKTGTHPIGITYDNAAQQLWVAIYTGALLVFDDK